MKGSCTRVFLSIVLLVIVVSSLISTRILITKIIFVVIVNISRIFGGMRSRCKATAGVATDGVVVPVETKVDDSVAAPAPVVVEETRTVDTGSSRETVSTRKTSDGGDITGTMAKAVGKGFILVFQGSEVTRSLGIDNFEYV